MEPPLGGGGGGGGGGEASANPTPATSTENMCADRLPILRRLTATVLLAKRKSDSISQVYTRGT